MEMDYKQWIVDFVNQSLLQLSTCDVESKRYERTEFAEHLGEMNRQWQRVHGTLSRKVCSCVTVRREVWPLQNTMFGKILKDVHIVNLQCSLIVISLITLSNPVF